MARFCSKWLLYLSIYLPSLPTSLSISRARLTLVHRIIGLCYTPGAADNGTVTKSQGPRKNQDTEKMFYPPKLS